MKRLLLSLVLLFSAFAPIATAAPRADGKLEIFVLDIGQGDSTLIVSPKGKIVL